MATLTNTKIKDTYDGLLKTTDNEALDVSGVTLIEDGLGNASALSVGRSGNGVTITGSLNATLATAAQPNITSVGTLSSLSVSGNLAVDTNTLYVDAANNRVGIGTSSPSQKLHTYEPSGAVYNRIQNNLNSLYLGLESGGIAQVSSDSSSLKVMASTYTSFETAGSEAMRIDSSGNVGIGDAATNASLGISRISGGARLALQRTNSNTTGSVGQIGFQNLNGEYVSGIVAYGDGDDAGSHLAFHTTSDAVSTDDNVFELEERMRITSGGDVLIGTQTANCGGAVSMHTHIKNDDYVLGITTGSGASKQAVRFANDTVAVGSINLSTSSTSYNTSSDYRLKENVVEMTGALDRVDALKPSRFNFIADPEKTVDGFLAHEVQAIVPEAVTGEKDAVDEEGNPIYQGIDQSKIVPLLVGAIKELSAKVAALESQLNA